MWRSSSSHLLLSAPSPPVQVLLEVKVLALLLGETGAAVPPPLPPAPADDPKHVDQLVSTQFHLREHFSVLSLNA